MQPFLFEASKEDAKGAVALTVVAPARWARIQVRCDVLQAESRQEHFFHGAAEPFISPVAFRILLRTPEDIAPGLAIPVEAFHLSRLGCCPAGNGRSVGPELLALSAFAVRSAFGSRS